MFDPNFGSYKCSYDKGVATWFVNTVQCVRPEKGRDTDRATQAHIIPFQ
ncbi:MAG: hypothetical protein JWL63_978 [Rhodocyclales bacterium]|nr:hypothetical protein [Rhodocyclales bacterium]